MQSTTLTSKSRYAQEGIAVSSGMFSGYLVSINDRNREQSDEIRTQHPGGSQQDSSR